MGLTKSARRNRIHLRIKKTVRGTPEKPRLSVYRSNKEIYAQIINDIEGKTLAYASSRDQKSKKNSQNHKNVIPSNNPIVFEEYIVGPGDEFFISFSVNDIVESSNEEVTGDASIKFRVASANHKTGPHSDPDEIFTTFPL